MFRPKTKNTGKSLSNHIHILETPSDKYKWRAENHEINIKT